MQQAAMTRSGPLVGLSTGLRHGVQVSRRFPPMHRHRAGGLSGRPSCRIYLSQQVWALEWERMSGGWLEHSCGQDGISYPGGPPRLTFATLSAAIGYAERHGLDYRVIPPPRGGTSRKRRRPPASWLLRLVANGRGGAIYNA
jgi:hypothetical protein